jgi:hypothetical protein
MTRILLLVSLAALLSACRSEPPVVEPQVVAPPVVGGDRDAHGCIGSAGYSWCPRTQRCERPWELAAAAGFESSPAAFAKYCEAR